ncbi:AlbA family DNA-binding domain-containing protein [Nesterenkonia halotolerans]|uniref:Schlafen AlbA-2 domain-containing protein n=1 Tax=Nesterenkonia halotolerans TaxID=225325 RepID=A0ABR9J868_9MICC|nr:ATP-binding protein [Nesterenkonia halotolerans]MBE1515180.1 hypothetical protein [Nesterenkonia halotolerans]
MTGTNTGSESNGHARGVVIVEGRTDREKLVELLTFPEETHLEFKKDLNLGDPEAKLKFVKDAVAILNTFPGGYILVGVSDQGELALPVGSIKDRASYDSARLHDLVRGYIDGQFSVIPAIHEIDDHEVVLIYLEHPRDGLPIPFSKLAQYPDRNNPKNQKVVFQPGELWLREGARNVPLRHAHWNTLLAERDRRIREDARSTVDSIIQDLATALREGGVSLGSGSLLPLTTEMSDAAFTETVVTYLEAGKDLRLSQFTGQALSVLSSSDDHGRESILNKVTCVAAQAMYYERYDLLRKVLSGLVETYTPLTSSQAVQRLEIVNRLYVLGSLAVRQKQWAIIKDLVLQPYADPYGSYVYASWIRHGQVAASREGLFPKDNGSMMITAARQLMSEHSFLRPDLPDSAIPIANKLADDDVLFNSLCQFDILYCVIIENDPEDNGGAYPASSSMNQYRSDPAFVLLGSDADARKQMFPDGTDAEIAEAILTVFKVAKRESYGYGGHWWELPRLTQQFVQDHLGEGHDL